MTNFKKFEHRKPSEQNAVDVFAGHWDSDLAPLIPGVQAGNSALFYADSRPAQAAQALGQNGRLDGMDILELGPLEGAHSFAMERLGAASILSIEANVEAFLKCLIIKEILNLKYVRFMLGDVMEFLKENKKIFDIIFCSGILYHMEDPVQMIKYISNFTDKCFVWTHYFDPAHYPGPTRTPYPHHDGYILHQLEYPDMDYEKFWGGNRPIASWLNKDDIPWSRQNPKTLWRYDSEVVGDLVAVGVPFPGHILAQEG